MRRVKIFVDDKEDAFLGKTAFEKYDSWTDYDHIGRDANILDVKHDDMPDGRHVITVVFDANKA